MTGFSIDWLDLREQADRHARDQDLLERARTWLTAAPPASQPPVVVDLGAGTGSTLRAFGQEGGAVKDTSGSVIWRLVDLDEQLLSEARRRHGGSHQLETCTANLAAVEKLPLADSRLVTASALFDLVSIDFVRTLMNVLKCSGTDQPRGLYAALNYDGTTRWTPAHPLDEIVLDAFNRDQQRDKGLGPALGPAASHTVQTIFSEAGFQVTIADSPWQLSGADSALLNELIEGIAAAVAQDPAIDDGALAQWVSFRKINVPSGTCHVGHTDLLALPE